MEVHLRLERGELQRHLGVLKPPPASPSLVMSLNIHALCGLSTSQFQKRLTSISAVKEGHVECCVKVFNRTIFII